jgi:hypothetical protein
MKLLFKMLVVFLSPFILAYAFIAADREYRNRLI